MSYLTNVVRMMYQQLYESVDNINPSAIIHWNSSNDVTDGYEFIPSPGEEESSLRFWLIRTARVLRLLWKGL